MSKIKKTIKWRSPKEFPKPRKGKDNSDGRYSKRVLVWWQWKRDSTRKEQPRFGYYIFPMQYWQVEGITGETEVLAWAYISNPFK